MTTKTSTKYTDFKFEKSDILLAGRESAGVPDNILKSIDETVTIPMVAKARSLNVAISCAIILSEALRQTKLFP